MMGAAIICRPQGRLEHDSGAAIQYDRRNVATWPLGIITDSIGGFGSCGHTSSGTMIGLTTEFNFSRRIDAEDVYKKEVKV